MVHTVPIHVEADSFTNITQHDVVIAVDAIGCHGHFLTIYEEAMVAQLCDDACSVSYRATEEHCADQKTGHKGSDSFHVLSPHLSISNHSL